MTTITDLPVEIIDRFADHFTKAQDLCNVRLTCRLFGEIFRRRVFRTIVLDFHDLKKIQRLIELASGPSDMHFYARNLEIRRLAPAGSELVLQHCIEGAGTWGYPQGLIQSGIHQAIQTITRHLPNALRHFHHLHNVSWVIGRVDGNSTNMPIMDLLCAQQNLGKVHISMASNFRVPHPGLGRLSRLTDLSFSFPPTYVRSGLLFCGVAQVLANSPDLASLRLEVPPKYAHPDLIELDQVYKSLSSLSQLETLELVIPAISSLNEFAVFDNMPRLTTLKLRSTDHTDGWGVLWKALRKYRIHLKTISFNIVFMETSFIDYLNSYSGVEELRLSNHEKCFVGGSIDRTALGVAFFKAIEGNHRDSIRALETSFNARSGSDPWKDVVIPCARFPRLEMIVSELAAVPLRIFRF